MSPAAAPVASVTTSDTVPCTLSEFVGYFLRLGTFGFGGPIALAGYMQRDLVERRRWISKQDYLEGLARRPDPVNKPAIDSLVKIAGTYQNKLDSLQKAAALPIGIRYSIFYSSQRYSRNYFVLKVLGILISGFAASLGAPFWFDILRKAIALKSK